MIVNIILIFCQILGFIMVSIFSSIALLYIIYYFDDPLIAKTTCEDKTDLFNIFKKRMILKRL
jgi:hypothetical protein